MRNNREEIRMQPRTFVLPKAGVAFDQNNIWPADKCTAFDVQKSVVIVGANGSGKAIAVIWLPGSSNVTAPGRSGARGLP
jgi:hypothetical protein